jgi:cysteine desulfurase family protein (TIGR01976 family)
VAALALDVDAVRARFSALGRGWALFDGPGGTQVPDSVIDAIAGYLRESNANLGGQFEASVRSDALVAEARLAGAGFLGCAPEEVVFGQNMTTLNFALSRTAGRELRAGDEILATKLDHDANVAPWLELAHDLELNVRLVELRDDTTLDLDDLRSKLSERTRVVAFPLASNAVGTLVDARLVSELAHEVGALAWADAVHFAPHGPIDVAELGVDVLVCSPYKFFGPHLGIAAIRPDLAASLPADRVRPSAETPPGHRFETGTQSHEAVAGTVAAVDYLRSLGDGSLDTAFERIQAYEDELTREFLAALPEQIELYGVGEVAGRTPTFCFNLPGRSPRWVAERLGERGIYVWDGDYYALEPMRALGLSETGGAVRAGCLHYTSLDELRHLVLVLEGLTRI